MEGVMSPADQAPKKGLLEKMGLTKKKSTQQPPAQPVSAENATKLLTGVR
jgi:hypothetical protein